MVDSLQAVGKRYTSFNFSDYY